MADEAVDRWLAAAAEDIRVAELALSANPPLLRSALFHAQQAGEKALKAVIVEGGSAPPRTHDLPLLLDLCLPLWPGAATIRAEAELITDYAVDPRYPDVASSYDEAEARAALEAARRILAAVRSRE